MYQQHSQQFSSPVYINYQHSNKSHYQQQNKCNVVKKFKVTDLLK